MALGRVVPLRALDVLLASGAGDLLRDVHDHEVGRADGPDLGADHYHLCQPAQVRGTPGVAARAPRIDIMQWTTRIGSG